MCKEPFVNDEGVNPAVDYHPIHGRGERVVILSVASCYGNLQWTSIPSRGGRGSSTTSHFIIQLQWTSIPSRGGRGSSTTSHFIIQLQWTSIPFWGGGGGVVLLVTS